MQIRLFDPVPRCRGFTMIEMVSVIVILGIISAVAMPRFFDRAGFDARGFYDQSFAMIRYAHNVAVAQRRNVFVNATTTTNTICLTYVADATCASSTGVINPSTNAVFSKQAPAGITLSASVSFSFSSVGKPNPDSAQTVGILGDGTTRTITIERETGYVHAP